MVFIRDRKEQAPLTKHVQILELFFFPCLSRPDLEEGFLFVLTDFFFLTLFPDAACRSDKSNP